MKVWKFEKNLTSGASDIKGVKGIYHRFTGTLTNASIIGYDTSRQVMDPAETINYTLQFIEGIGFSNYCGHSN